MAFNNFFVSYDTEDLINALSDQNAGKLFKALYAYAKRGEIPDRSGDSMTDYAFLALKKDIESFSKYRAGQNELQRLKALKMHYAGNMKIEQEITNRTVFLSKDKNIEHYNEAFKDISELFPEIKSRKE